MEGEPLKDCRGSLSEKGFSPELACGAKVFVAPQHFEPVMRAVQGQDLKPWHVLASDDFCDLVTDTVSSLPSRAQVREKSHRAVSIDPSACLACGTAGARYRCFQCRQAVYCSRTCQQRDWREHHASCEPGLPVLVKRTFLNVQVPSSLWSGPTSSTQTASTTDADPRKPPNHRACGGVAQPAPHIQ